MTIDLFLLHKTILENEILFTLRFYLWEGNWISIGYHQKKIPDHWIELSKKGIIKIVKRPSGGGAVLHSGGITYAITFQKPSYKKFSYQIVNKWLKNSFADLGVNLENGRKIKSEIKQNCFGTSHITDLIDQNGFKRIGSAQYWKGGSFLQHGEIQVNPPYNLWCEIFREEPPPPLEINLNREQIISHLKNSFLKNYSDKYIENIFINYKDLDSF